MQRFCRLAEVGLSYSLMLGLEVCYIPCVSYHLVAEANPGEDANEDSGEGDCAL
jgi:hypothetical protein